MLGIKPLEIGQSLHKKWSFPLRIFSVNVTKCAVSCGNQFLCSESKSFWRFFCIFIVDFEYGFFCCQYRGIMSTPNKRYMFNINKKNTRTMLFHIYFNPLSGNFTKWSNTLKQFVGNLPTNCLTVFDHFVGLALKRL